jgi:hypothetical protein
MLVARLYIHIAHADEFISEDDEYSDLYTKYCEESTDDEEEKWWRKFWDNRRKGYSPVSDIRKYWESMHIDDFVSNRLGAVVHLYSDTPESDLIEPKVIAEDFRGKPVTCACRMFAMNHDMPIMPAPKDGADGSSLAKDPGLQWRAMRNVVGQLRTNYNSNMDVELEILDEGWKKERETADGVKDPTAVGCYEYLRRSVLGAKNSTQMIQELELGAAVGDGERVTLIEDGLVKGAECMCCMAGIDCDTVDPKANVDVLDIVRNKEVFVVNASGKEIAKALVGTRTITVKTSEPNGEKETAARDALASLNGAVGGVKFRDLRLHDYPTFFVAHLTENYAVTLQGELISDTHGTEWTADSNAERREEIVVGKEEGVVAHLHGLLVAESFNGGKRVETTVWTRGGDGGYVRTEFSKKGNGDEVEANEVGIEELLEAIGSRKPGAPKSLRNLIAIYRSITLAGVDPVVSIMKDDDEPNEDSGEEEEEENGKSDVSVKRDDSAVMSDAQSEGEVAEIAPGIAKIVSDSAEVSDVPNDESIVKSKSAAGTPPNREEEDAEERAEDTPPVDEEEDINVLKATAIIED